MTVYVTGDIHGGLDMQKLRDWELGDSLGSDDYLIIAGDFGFPWDFSAEECADIAWLESRPYTVLFVDGNHERFDHWEERPMEPWHGGLTQRLSDTSSIRRLMRGEVFELDGKTVFTMGGATSVDREYRVPYSSWWPQELPDERDSLPSSTTGSATEPGSSATTTVTSGVTTGTVWSIETSCRSKVLRPVLSSRNPLEML